VLEDEHTLRLKERDEECLQPLHRFTVLDIGVRRVGKDEIEALSPLPERSGRSGHVRGDDTNLVADTERLDVGVERRERLLRSLDEDDPPRPARESLQPERARPGVKIEHPLGRGARPEDTKECFAHPVGGGTSEAPLRRLERARSVLPAGDPHPSRSLASPRPASELFRAFFRAARLASQAEYVLEPCEAFAAIGYLAIGLTTLLLLGLSHAAFAEAPGPRTPPVHVLGIDSDDVEDQADALTGALRSRVRSAPGWSLQETQHPLGMLTAALRCPPKPDAACLQRIADQLHTDRFVWGLMSKGPGNQVTADIHLWVRGKPDTAYKETYSDNLQDQNDETLRRIAERILDKLGGTVTTGTVTVHAGDAVGVVWVGGQQKRALEHGAATITLPPGRYDVELRAEGFPTAKQDGVVVSAGQDTSIALKLEPAPVPIAQPEPAKGASRPRARVVAGWVFVGVGVVAEIVAGVEGIEFLSAKNDLDSARQQVPSQVTDVCNNGSQQFTSQPAAESACSKYNQASTDRTVGIAVASGGLVALAVGTVLLLTAPKETGEPTASPNARIDRPRLQILPYVGSSVRGGGGVNLSLTF